jgi:hypothetical protein
MFKVWTQGVDEAGASTGFSYRGWQLGIDNIPPTTSIMCNGAACMPSYRTVTITFPCSDGDGSGCDANDILYCNNTAPGCTPGIYFRGQTITLPDGVHYVRFRSRDNVGNTETIKSATIIVDNTPPIAWIQPLRQWTNASSDGSVYINVTRNATDPVHSTDGSLVDMSLQYAVFDSASGGKVVDWRDWIWISQSGQLMLTGNGTKSLEITNNDKIKDPTGDVSIPGGREGRTVMFRLRAADQAGNERWVPAKPAYDTGPSWPNTTIDTTPPTCSIERAVMAASGGSHYKGGSWFVNGLYNFSSVGVDAVSGAGYYDLNVRSPEFSGAWHPIADAGFCNRTMLPASLNSLVGFWRFEGTANDYSGNGNHGTAGNGAGSAAGKIGQAYSFNRATGSYVDMHNLDGLGSDLSSDFTFAAWLNTAQPIGVIFAKTNTWWGNYNKALLFDDPSIYDAACCNTGSCTGGERCYNSRVSVWFQNPGDTEPYFLASSSGLKLDTWTFVAVTYNAAQKRFIIYINGSQDFVADNVILTPDKDPGYDYTNFRLGKSPNGAYNLSGSLDEVMFFSRTLSAAEIGGIYNAQAYQYQNDPGAAYCLPGADRNIYTYSCRAVDRAGNVGRWSGNPDTPGTANISVKVDTSPPNATFDSISQWIGHSSREWLGPEMFNLSWDSDHGSHYEDNEGSGSMCFYVQWKNTTVGWREVTSTYNSTDPACLNPDSALRYFRLGEDYGGTYANTTRLADDLEYFFQVKAVDSLGNSDGWSLYGPVTLDRTNPRITVNVTDDTGKTLDYGYLDARMTDKVNVTSNATDALSGIGKSQIEDTVISTSLDTFQKIYNSVGDCFNSSLQGTDSASSRLGLDSGWVFCQLATDYADGTSITFNATARDRAGNVNYTQGVLTTHPLANFLIHFAVLQLGMSVDIPVQVRNTKPTVQTVTLGLEEYQNAVFQPASDATIENAGRLMRLEVSPGEQRTVYVRAIANDVTDAPMRLNLTAIASPSGIQDNDTAFIMVTYPADFPAFDASWAILLMMAFAAVLFYRTERK